MEDEAIWEEEVDADSECMKDDGDWSVPNEEEVTITYVGDDCNGEVELSMDFLDTEDRDPTSHVEETVVTAERSSKRNAKKFSLGDILPPPRKHKKHKHKKHKKKRSDSEGSQGESASAVKSTASSIPTSGSPLRVSYVKISTAAVISPKSLSSKKKKGKSGRDSGTSSDEERWLDAIESGKLEEVDDELKKIRTKDPKLMTARQRAMLERKGDAVPDPSAEQLLSLPTGYREKIMTPEMMKKAALKSQKRKQLQDEKREKDKKRTMERLLRKQDNKASKQVARKNTKKAGAMITYCNSVHGISLTLPVGVEYPIQKKVSPQVPEPIKCGVKGCTNMKKYSCAKTKVPLCSLECYKKNFAYHNIAVK